MLYIKYSTAGDGNDCEDIPKGLIAAPSPARIFLEDINYELNRNQKKMSYRIISDVDNLSKIEKEIVFNNYFK